MLDDENPTTETSAEAPETLFGAGTSEETAAEAAEPAAPAKKAPARKAAKKTTRKSTAKKTAAPAPAADAPAGGEAPPAPDGTAAVVSPEEGASGDEAAGASAAAPAKKATKKAAAKKTTAKKAAKTTAKKTTAKRTAKKTAAEESAAAEPAAAAPTAEEPVAGESAAEEPAETATSAAPEPAAATAAPGVPVPLFQPPTPPPAGRTRRGRRKPEPEADAEPTAETVQEEPAAEDREDQAEDQGDGEQGGRRRRRRGGRRRRKSGGDSEGQSQSGQGESGQDESSQDDAAKQGGKQKAKPEGEEQSESPGSRRRRRRRRSGEDSEAAGDEPENTVTRVRKGRSAEDEITALSGSTRLEAKRQRRREGREAGRRRAPIVSEAEFLARRESVDRVMVIRQRDDLTQIAVLEDNVLVEHYVARESQTSLIGNVYLGRVQNVLPSMEAAFIDIGKGRNAVLYAGEVNWDALGSKDGNRKIEQVLKSGQSVLVQVTKDPIGHKGARLTSQIALPGRFLVYVPDGTTSGISRKLPDTERSRLKTLLKQIVPESAGVIVRTAAEGASEEELTRDVERLTARWNDISAKVEKGNAPQLLYGEPDLTLKVVRDLFTEDFRRLVVSGDDAWDMVDGYVEHVAPDLADRLERWGDADKDVFAEFRIDEQIAKGLDRKVWLPSGGSLIIDRTEAMTVIDVNTGKFTGSGGNLEETVTKNNLEAAEEIVRQLRLRDIGGIVVIDFIDMVLESNRDLVLRRLVECLGRDRTRHQVAEVTSLGLVQMTRKRIGTGLLEAFSESCEHCQGRGLLLHPEPIETKKKAEEEPRRGRRSGRGRGKEDQGNGAPQPPSPKDIAAMARPEQVREGENAPADGEPKDQPKPEAASDGKAQSEPESSPEPTAPEPAPSEPTAPEHAETVAGTEPVTAPATAPPEPAAPKVVTRVRRRSSRPAGPPGGAPTAASDNGSAPADDAGDTSEGSDASGRDADGEQGDGGSASVGHVPVKTKTGRRR